MDDKFNMINRARLLLICLIKSIKLDLLTRIYREILYQSISYNKLLLPDSLDSFIDINLFIYRFIKDYFEIPNPSSSTPSFVDLRKPDYD